MDQSVFERVEQKYLLDPEKLLRIRSAMAGRMQPDQYGRCTVYNVYYDTADDLLLTRSLEKPYYKEKLRLRCYGPASPESKCFLEIKKKVAGVVYKRRLALTLTEAEQWVAGGKRPVDSQIARELDAFLARYRPVPKTVLCYDRQAFYAVDDPQFRLTFDQNLRFRSDELSLQKGDFGEALLPPDQTLMEVKLLGAMPLWFARALSAAQVYPESFSKIGRAYPLQKAREDAWFGKLRPTCADQTPRSRRASFAAKVETIAANRRSPGFLSPELQGNEKGVWNHA